MKVPRSPGMGGWKFRALHTSATTAGCAPSNCPCKPCTEALRGKELLTLLYRGCSKVQLIQPPRNCSGFKTESHISRLRVSRAPFVIGCKIYVCLLHQPRHVYQEDVQTRATTSRQRVDVEHKHNRDITPTEINRACLKASPSCIRHSLMAGFWFR